MKCLAGIAIALVAAAVPAANTGGLHCAFHTHCMHGEPAKPDCTPPCGCWRPGPLCGDAHTQKLIETLAHSHECCERIKVAKKLGCCLHADFCSNPEVLHALVHALTCDRCWEVRRAAAWSIAYQKARVPEGVAALYIAARLDRHYLVRDAAAGAMEVLLPGRRDCFKDLFLAIDQLIVRIRADYDPTNGKCVSLLTDWLSHCGEGGAPIAVVVPQPEGS